MIKRLIAIREREKLNQEEFAKKIGVSRNFISLVETGKRNLSDRTIADICRTFNINETWFRTGGGEMFTPSPDGALEALAREYELSPGMYILIKRLLALKPENQQAAIDFAVKLAEDLNKSTTAPEVVSKNATTAPTPDATGQERTETDIVAELAELRRQNQELAAKVAAMEEEDALLGLADGFSISPTESAGSIKPAAKAKK